MEDIILPDIISIGVYDASVHYKNIKETKKRLVSMFEIEMPTEEGGYTYINDMKEKIMTDMLICAKPGHIRHTALPFKCYYAHILVNSGAIYDILTAAPAVLHIQKPEKYMDIFKEMYRYYETGTENAKLMIQSLILKLAYMIKKDCTPLEFNIKKDAVIEKAIKFLDERFTENISLEEIAEYVSLSPIYFHGRFKGSVGITPREYINKKRIRKAQNLLITTDWDISRIAYECGFSSQSYFNYAFKKQIKMTPKEYMRKTYSKYAEEDSFN